MTYKWRLTDANIVFNLRSRWPKNLKRFTDLELASEYSDFGQSEYFGNNDEKFLEWLNINDG